MPSMSSNGVEAEHLQVRRIRADVHAFVHVGDRIARGFDERVAAALGLAHLRFEPAQRTPGFEVGPFGAHRAQQVLGWPRSAMPRTPAPSASLRLASSTRSATAITGRSLPLPRTSCRTSSSGRPSDLLAARTRSMTCAAEHRRQFLGVGRPRRTAPRYRHCAGALTMASASSTLSSTIIRRNAVSVPFCIQFSVARLLHDGCSGVQWEGFNQLQRALPRLAGYFPHESRHQVA